MFSQTLPTFPVFILFNLDMFIWRLSDELSLSHLETKDWVIHHQPLQPLSLILSLAGVRSKTQEISDRI